MDLLTGGELGECLGRETEPLSPVHACDLLLEVLSGLQAIHEHGLLHGDVKDRNIVFAEDGRPVIVDFDSALPLADGTAARVRGTRHWMAPEVRDAPVVVDRRSDIYSAGILLSLLLTRSPLADLSQEATRSSCLAHLEDDLATLATRACAQDPSDRFVTALEFADAIRVVRVTLPRADAGESRFGLAPARDPRPASHPESAPTWRSAETTT